MNSLLRVALSLLLLAFCAGAYAQGQNYPSKPIRMLVGYAAGGGADGLARMLAAKLSENLGQQVLVENRPGAAGTLAADALAKAAPDGYTLYFAETGILIAPSMYARLPYDTLKSFAPVAGVCTLPLAFVVNPGFPAKNVQELISLLRAAPGKYSYASPGIGTVQHFAAEMFKKMAGVDAVHIPYKGAAPILPDLISGQVPIAVISAAPAIAQARAGRLRAIALTGRERLQSVPDWPTLAETLPGFDAAPRLFLLAPAGTPQAIVLRLGEAVRSALAAKDLLDGFEKQGTSAMPMSADELGVLIAAEVSRWAAVAKDSGIKPE
jgi:tripartite-type tricarboxylate transporter receptor subunit TctC